jgi:hypothetical protein
MFLAVRAAPAFYAGVSSSRGPTPTIAISDAQSFHLSASVSPLI